MASQKFVNIKLSRGNLPKQVFTWRLGVNGELGTWVPLQQKIAQMYGIRNPYTVRLEYLDSDGDLILIDTHEQYSYCVERHANKPDVFKATVTVSSFKGTYQGHTTLNPLLLRRLPMDQTLFHHNTRLKKKHLLIP